MKVAQEASKILIVDDLEENAVILSRFLAPHGFNTSSVTSGEAALKYVEETPPDVILLDLMMPDMNGFEVCQNLKQNPATRHIPIIVVSGLADRDANVRAIEAGADDFLLKPFDSVLLEARIKSSIRSKLLHDQIFEYQDQLETHNETLEDKVRERTSEVVRTQLVTVFSLAKLAESRDLETGDHLERMRRYAQVVARETITLDKYKDEYGDDFVQEIYQSSPLHDIGKVGIPDSILLKPGKLTEEEFDIMKTHSLIGGDTLKAADEQAGTDSFLAMGRDIAYYHHEKWNGSGYPFGLSGEDIPLASRIVAIGDVYDALSSKRPYKEPMSHEVSMKIIIEGRGSHFDPEVVDAFLERENEIIAIREAFQSEGRLDHEFSNISNMTAAAASQ